VLGLALGDLVDRTAARPIQVVRREMMAEEIKAPEFLERATKAATRSMPVPLNEFVLRPELYCHRADEELDKADRLESLMASLTVEGLQTPVEFFRSPDGKPVLVKGHRRITSMRALAKKNTPGFSENMEVQAVEVLNATPQDLLCRSVADNSNRNTYSLMERIRAAKTLHDGGVEHSRAAYALGYSPKQYSRDLRIARHSWMFTYVEQDDIGATQASDLLEAAEAAGRVADLQAHVGSWIDSRKTEREKEISLKGKAGKEKKLKTELTTPLSDHWIEQLRNKLPLDDMLTAKSETVIGIDADANMVIFNEAEIDLLKIDLADLAKAVAKLSTAQKIMLGYLKKRYAVEGSHGPQDVARHEGQELDVSLLRSEGLNDLANALAGAQEPPDQENQKKGGSKDETASS
jgi:ParB-like chromosome segregation protein Spo0J